MLIKFAQQTALLFFCILIASQVVATDHIPLSELQKSIQLIQPNPQKKSTYRQVWKIVKPLLSEEAQKNYTSVFLMYADQEFPTLELQNHSKYGSQQLKATTAKQELFFYFPKKDSLEEIQYEKTLFRLEDSENINKLFSGIFQDNPGSFEKNLFDPDWKPSTFALSPESLKALSPMERIHYMMNLRLILDLTEKVQTSTSKNASHSIWPMLIFENVEATPRSTSCLDAGWITTFSGTGANRSCSFTNAVVGRRNRDGTEVGGTSSFLPNPLRACPSTQAPCNPLLFGFADGATNRPHCVERSAGRGGSSTNKRCADASPINSDEQSVQALANQIFNAYKNTPQSNPAWQQSQNEMRNCPQLFQNGRVASEACFRYVAAYGQLIYENAKAAAEACERQREAREVCEELQRRYRIFERVSLDWQLRRGSSSVVGSSPSPGSEADARNMMAQPQSPALVSGISAAGTVPVAITQQRLRRRGPAGTATGAAGVTGATPVEAPAGRGRPSTGIR